MRMSPIRARWILLCGVLIMAAAVTPAVRAGSVLHVDDGAPAGGDGSSWSSAFRFLTDALGIPMAEMGRPDDLLPNSLLVMHAWTKSALEFSLLELIASHNFVNDHTNTIAYPRLCEALMGHYGLSRKAVTWFDLHGEVDKAHGAMSRSVLSQLVQTEEDRRVVRYAVKFGLGIKWALFDGVMNAYVNKSYPI